MSRDALLSVGLLCTVFSLSVQSCVLRSIPVQVPAVLQVGDVISKVDVSGCGLSPLHLKSRDPDFTVETSGTIITVTVKTVPAKRRSFSMCEQYQKDLCWKVEVTPSQRHESQAVLKRESHSRFKRRWRPLPFSIIENDTPPFPKDIEWIASDSLANHSVYYQISGPGVTTPPLEVFSVKDNPANGWSMLRVNHAVDREEYPQFSFTARVYDRRTHKETDFHLPIIVNVEDVNDNAPEFSGSLRFSVDEQCSTGTMVGTVNATDKDDPNTPHTRIKYSLLTGAELFFISSYSGVITSKTHTLDRETQDTHLVTVEIRDMGGTPVGLFNTATATISLNDINDNRPTFRETTYKAKVPENQADTLILRIPVDDKDLEKTPNWNAIFKITKGNENGNFRIETDPKTNEGLLYVTKPLDHEKGEVLMLELLAQNESPLVGSASSWLSVPVELTVGDIDEGPEFSPPILRLHIKENIPNGTLIGTYTATDPETRSSKGIKYYKMSDPASWIRVVESSGELKTADTIDRESLFVSNSMYNITVKAVDESGKMGTGAVLILIEDINDNVPLILVPDRVLCEKDGKLGSILLEAVDQDRDPYSDPFTFQLGDTHDGKWRLKGATGSSVLLEQAVDLPIGVYSVPVLVKDLQGIGRVQMVTIRVCECVMEKDGEGVCVAQRNSAALGVLAIIAMLLALLLLLFILCMFVCTTQREKLYIDDSCGGMLLKSNTEAPGEEVKGGTLLIMPSSAVEVDAVDGSVKGALPNVQTTTGSGGMACGQQTVQEGMFQTPAQDFMTVGRQSTNYYTASRHYGGGGYYGDSKMYKYSELSTFDTWKTNQLYLDKKLVFFCEEEEGRYAADLLKDYGYEGEGSPAGSVGCCSDLSDQDALDFLDSLGPKFRTLADICMDKQEEDEE